MPPSKDQIESFFHRIAARKPLHRLLRSPAAGLEAMESPEVVKKKVLAEEGLKRINVGKELLPEQSGALEAIILPKIRPVLDVVDGDFQTDHPLWLMLNTDQAIRGKLLQAIPLIGRVELPGNPYYPYGGTGFVVGKDLVMTNRHVAAIFASGVGTGEVTFKPGHRAGIDFLQELDRPTGPVFAVRGIVMVHPYWDMALLRVEGLEHKGEPLRLAASEPAAGTEAMVAAIGYPAFDTRNDSDVQNDLFRETFGVKRLQPGMLGGREDTESFGKIVSAARHNCSTLGGNSGSAILDLNSGHVLALHFGGRYLDTNYGVPALELARDPRVRDAGVLFAADGPGTDANLKPWWDGADDASPAENEPEASDGVRQPPEPSPVAVGSLSEGNGCVKITIPVTVTVHCGSGTRGVAVDAAVRPEGEPQAAGVEALVMPWHNNNYATREGYKRNFLGVDVPIPEPVDPGVVARTKSGGRILHYRNFSVMMHAERRIALFTASNVTAESKLKKPQPGRKYTRKALSGLGENDQERWFPDPRLSDNYQLPDVFYTRDDGAFDKGHIVRREDVAWGEKYDLLREANGDTYHVTNCSPQVAQFNRSNLGDDNWGSLENHILASAATERCCQFAGPVLDPKDEIFLGRLDKGVRVRVRIPSRYWKVIVVRTKKALASYGFVLEQDLAQVPMVEFVVPHTFERFTEPLVELQKLAGIKFDNTVLTADQYDKSEGVEMAHRAGWRRRR
jgi:endonuclease G, mitochondrial